MRPVRVAKGLIHLQPILWTEHWLWQYVLQLPRAPSHFRHSRLHLAYTNNERLLQLKHKPDTVRLDLAKAKSIWLLQFVNSYHGVDDEHVFGSTILYLLVHFITRENETMVVNHPMLISLPMLVNGPLLC